MIPTNILKQKEISNKLIDKKHDKILKSMKTFVLMM